MSAQVIHLPIEVTCFQCQHYAFNFLGSGRCQLFDEEVDSEIFAARDCAGFERT